MPEGPSLGESKPGKGTNGKYVLTVVDPQGYTITLDLHTWENHIVKNHPEMVKHFDLLAVTLTEPELILRASKRPETHYYYRLTGRSFARSKDIYLSPVVSRDEGTRSGHVKTAHLLKNIRREEAEVVWMKRK